MKVFMWDLSTCAPLPPGVIGVGSGVAGCSYLRCVVVGIGVVWWPCVDVWRIETVECFGAPQ